MIFMEEYRMIREEKAILMSSMTLKEPNDYINTGAKQVLNKIEELREENLLFNESL